MFGLGTYSLLLQNALIYGKFLLTLWPAGVIIILGMKTNTGGGYIMKRQSILVLVKRRIWEIPDNVSC